MARCVTHPKHFKLWVTVLRVLLLGNTIQGQLNITDLHSSLISPSYPTGSQITQVDTWTKSLQASFSIALTTDGQSNQYIISDLLSPMDEHTDLTEREHIVHSTAIYTDELPNKTENLTGVFKNNISLQLETATSNDYFSKVFENLDISHFIQNASSYFNDAIFRSEVLFTPIPFLQPEISSPTEVDHYITSVPFSKAYSEHTSSRDKGKTALSSFPSCSYNSTENISVLNQDAFFNASKVSSISPLFSSVIFYGSNKPINSSRTISSTQMSIHSTMKNASEVYHYTPEPTTPKSLEKGRSFKLTLKAKSCPQGFKRTLEKQLLKINSSFGSTNFSVHEKHISLAECNTQFTINITVFGSSILDEIVSSDPHGPENNVTLDIFNRAFYISSIEKLYYEPSENVTSNSSSITKVSRHEFSAYVTVGVSFGLVLIVCITVCCAKLCLKRSIKTLGVSRSSQIQLRFEDYTLTPIPRPSSLRVDYYRGSLTGDLYSTTSAGSIASTPTVESGVIQPFDTSIIPLEDSVAILEDTSRRPSVESGTNLNIPNINTPYARNSSSVQGSNSKTESKERLHLKHQKQGENKSGDKNCGLANPIFQRY